jgi:hypothetical protein
MILLVARTRDKANADRLMKFLEKAGSTHIKEAREKDGTFVVKFTEPNAIETYLRHKKSAGRKALNKILRDLDSSRRILGLLLDGSPDAVALRSKVAAIARKEISDFPR